MAVDTQALEVLGQLERAEAGVLSWGLIDGFFSETEVEQLADEYLTAITNTGAESAHDSG